MHANSPPGKAFALDLTALRSADITFLTLWEGDELLGCGAMKELSPLHGELKSMRTHQDHLRKGVAARLLAEFMALGLQRGYERLSLETGKGVLFEPALALYARFGFEEGDKFADYQPSDFNQFFHLDL
ncbi:MAG: N-acetyltransferase [Ponticaulis sp.]|nr:N-acetyltransferase [Ponticaulis sp.]